jgi:hypothetical protein
MVLQPASCLQGTDEIAYDSLTPPNGQEGWEMRPVLAPTMPTCNASDTLQTRPMSREKKYRTKSAKLATPVYSYPPCQPKFGVIRQSDNLVFSLEFDQRSKRPKCFFFQDDGISGDVDQDSGLEERPWASLAAYKRFRTLADRVLNMFFDLDRGLGVDQGSMSTCHPRQRCVSAAIMKWKFPLTHMPSSSPLPTLKPRTAMASFAANES